MLSLCMIVKNEEDFLGECLASFQGLVDEIIIVDTGSTDKTIDIAQQHGAKVLHFTWIDDFSAARNFALEHATGDWIIMPDADDRIDLQDHEKVRQCLADKTVWGYRISIRNYSNESFQHNWHATTDNVHARGFSGFLLTHIVKLFQNKKEIRYRFSVHESVTFSIQDNHGIIKDTPFVFHHYGSIRGNDTKQEKHDYYASLLQKDCRQYPNHSKPFYELGIALFEKKRYNEAKEAFLRAVQNNDKYLTPYHYLAEIALQQEEDEEARDFFLKNIQLQPRHAESYFLLGNILHQFGGAQKAKDAFQTAVHLNPRSVRYNRALIQLLLGQQKMLEALAILHDAYVNTGQLEQQKNELEQKIIQQALSRLQQGQNEQAYIWLATIALYRREKEKVIALCEQAKRYYPTSKAIAHIRAVAEKIQISAFI